MIMMTQMKRSDKGRNGSDIHVFITSHLTLKNRTLREGETRNLEYSAGLRSKFNLSQRHPKQSETFYFSVSTDKTK